MRFEPAFAAVMLTILGGCDGSKPVGTTTTAATVAATTAAPRPGASTGSASATAPEPAAASASAEPPIDPKLVGVVAGPYAASKVADAVNPKHEAAYSGPTGVVRGVVRITGDPAPTSSVTFPTKCGEASATHGRLFRTGLGGALADALVTVTGYAGFVPELHEAKKVAIHGCALSKRTISMTFGQRLEVSNTDTIEAYMPYLEGAPGKALMVAVPGGPAVKLYPTEPTGQFPQHRLRDQLDKTWMVGDVFVLKFATHDVTGLDGKFEIRRVPVGKARVNAYLPAIEWRVEKEIDVKEGDNSVDFELTWKRGADDAGAPSK